MLAKRGRRPPGPEAVRFTTESGVGEPAPRLRTRRVAALALAVFLLAFAVRLWYVFEVPHDHDVYPVRIDKWADIALSLAQGEGYGIPVAGTGVTNPTAFRVPAYPVYLAAVFLASDGSDTVALAGQCALDGLTAALVFLLGLAVYGRIGVGLLAGLFFALYSPEWNTVNRLFAEPLYTLLLAVLLWRLWHTMCLPTLRGFAASGFLAGLVALARPTGLLFLPLVAAWLWIVTRHDAPGRVRPVALMILTFCLVLSPWVIRNQIVFDEFMPVDTTGGVNLYNGTLGVTPYVGYEAYSPELRERLTRADEFDANRLLRAEGIRRIIEDPAGHGERSVKRFAMYFFRFVSPETSWELNTRASAGNAAIYALAVLGWIWSSGRRRTFATLLALLILYAGLIHSQLVVQSRFFFPVLPCLMLLAAAGAYGTVTTLWARRGWRKATV